MNESTTSVSPPIKVGVITAQTGALSFMGIANANVARRPSWPSLRAKGNEPFRVSWRLQLV